VVYPCEWNVAVMLYHYWWFEIKQRFGTGQRCIHTDKPPTDKNPEKIVRNLKHHNHRQFRHNREINDDEWSGDTVSNLQPVEENKTITLSSKPRF